MTVSLVILLLAAIVFDFLNGFHDSSNIVATMISSRAFTGRQALAITTVCEVTGPFLFGVAVATTIGSELVGGSALTQGAVFMPVIIAALFGAIAWNVLTWWLGIPSSSSHALIGGIVGSVAVEFGLEAIQWAGMRKVLIALFLSPILGAAAGFIIQRSLLHTMVWMRATPKANWFFRNAQFGTAVALALAHGTNDAQKTMGIITMGLVATGAISSFHVPFWVMVVSAAAIGAGTATGGWRLIKTLGYGFYKIWPIHAFTSQLASGSVILGAAVLGGPVSTTQVMSSAIVGVGASENFRKVRWQVAGNIVLAWVLTIPASAAVSGGLYWIFKALGGTGN